MANFNNYDTWNPNTAGFLNMAGAWSNQTGTTCMPTMSTTPAPVVTTTMPASVATISNAAPVLCAVSTTAPNTPAVITTSGVASAACVAVTATAAPTAAPMTYGSQPDGSWVPHPMAQMNAVNAGVNNYFGGTWGSRGMQANIMQMPSQQSMPIVCKGQPTSAAVALCDNTCFGGSNSTCSTPPSAIAAPTPYVRPNFFQWLFKPLMGLGGLISGK